MNMKDTTNRIFVRKKGLAILSKVPKKNNVMGIIVNKPVKSFISIALENKNEY